MNKHFALLNCGELAAEPVAESETNHSAPTM